ncbi:cytochrome c [Alsobacter sp. KACC 23698]|uniref:Cytochrome c n=1 Tax=Alsobacter sp. KACC 23698 TaxID=3149229 RepID=A0AAU7JNP4_9HYPH
MSQQTFAQDARAGRRLAERDCSACHEVRRGRPPGMKPGPSFSAVAQMVSTTELSISVFLQTSHQRMPNITLSRSEIRDLARYIVSLK